MPTLVHVNRHLAAKSRKTGERLPCYAVKAKGRTTYAHSVTFTGPCTLVDPRVADPLPCGATLYLTTEHPVILVDPCPYAEIDAKASA